LIDSNSGRKFGDERRRTLLSLTISRRLKALVLWDDTIGNHKLCCFTGQLPLFYVNDFTCGEYCSVETKGAAMSSTKKSCGSKERHRKNPEIDDGCINRRERV
jgi:hypothetical protein